MGTEDTEEVPTVPGAVRSLAAIEVVPFGKYKLIGKLGQGGMAEVYLAYSTGMGGFRKLVVIKRLHKHLAEEEEGFLGMFMDEARLAARLNHPNIVQTYEVGEQDGYHFLAMEYLDGQPFDRVRRRMIGHGPGLDVGVVSRIIYEVLDGLQYAHELKDYDNTALHVVHRDVSPQNVFLTYTGTVKLLDFGIAKAATQMVATQAGIFKGKLSYVAPEQLKSANIDRRADLWSTAVVLWECFAGRHLFKGDTQAATVTAVLQQPIPMLHTFKKVPEELSRIAARGLERDPAKRYQTAEEFQRDLGAFMRNANIQVGRTELSEFLKKNFKDQIDQNQRVLEACLSETSIETIPRARIMSLGKEPSPVDTLPSGTMPGPIAGQKLSIALAALIAVGTTLLILFVLLGGAWSLGLFGASDPRGSTVSIEDGLGAVETPAGTTVGGPIEAATTGPEVPSDDTLPGEPSGTEPAAATPPSDAGTEAASPEPPAEPVAKPKTKPTSEPKPPTPTIKRTR